MKYTPEQTKKIMNYVSKKAQEHSDSAMQIHMANINGVVKAHCEFTYGDHGDTASVIFKCNHSLNGYVLEDLVKKYKDVTAYVYIKKYDLSWQSETNDEVLDCLETVVKAETNMSLPKFIDKMKQCEQKEESEKKTLQELFFEEN